MFAIQTTEMPAINPTTHMALKMCLAIMALLRTFVRCVPSSIQEHNLIGCNQSPSGTVIYAL
jgi:hypothetical protein